MMSEVLARKIERIHAFDLLRGYFLIVILFNHLFYYPSGLEYFTGRGELYVSSAEGFFLISGIILGIVRGRKLIQQSFRIGALLLLKRALQLYVTGVVLAIVFTLIGWMVMDNPGLKFGILPPDAGFLDLVYRAATYQYIYGWADFLRHYAIFIALAPLALWLLRKGYWYVVLAASFGVWLLFPDDPTNGIMWQPVSWQLVFFSGFVIGFHWPEIQGRWRQIPIIWRSRIGGLLFGAFLLSASLAMLVVYGSQLSGAAADSLTNIHRVLEQHFDKDRLPLARLALGAVWFWGLFWFVRRHEAWIIKRLGWLLLPFGINSLYVYTIQAFIVFFMHLFVFTQNGSPSPIVNLLLSLATLGVVLLAVKKQFLMKIIPR